MRCVRRCLREGIGVFSPFFRGEGGGVVDSCFNIQPRQNEDHQFNLGKKLRTDLTGNI